MRTDELIVALTADGKRDTDMRTSFAIAMGVGLLLSATVFLWALGLRHDLVGAFTTWRFDVKMALLILAVGTAILASWRSSLPVVARATAALWLLPTALVVAVAAELALVDAPQWASRLIGTNARVCLTAVPALALTPLVTLLLAMRRGAPASPVGAGAIAGIAASAIGALLYGLHCFDDSPLFVAFWYPLASLPAVGAGALAGHWLLRW